jgi:hypothetical protein
MPNVIDDEDLYGVIVLAGATSPGKVTLSGHDRRTEWDVKSGPSLNGATTTLKAIPPVEFTATFYLVKDVAEGIDDYTAWDTFKKVIEATVAGSTPKAVDIYHPDLVENGIKSVVKATIGGRVYDGKGGCTIAVKFQEYRPPRKTGGTLSGSKSAKKDPNQDVKDELTRLTNQYQATPWG